jgi:hypothetical protein
MTGQTRQGRPIGRRYPADGAFAVSRAAYPQTPWPPLAGKIVELIFIGPKRAVLNSGRRRFFPLPVWGYSSGYHSGANQEGVHWRMNGKIVGLLNHSRVPLGHRVVAAIGSQPLHHLTFPEPGVSPAV